MSAPGASFHERVLVLGGGARVLFTERCDGNMSSVSGDGAEHGAGNRARLREQLGMSALACAHQVHGTLVRTVLAAPPPEGGAASDAAPRTNGGAAAPQVSPPLAPDADGQATKLRGVGVMVLAADCLPVALAGGGAVAMLHAGWRGIAAGVLEEGVRTLRGLTGGEPLLAVVGPGAGVCCYEVGAQVHAAFGGAHRHGDHIDLRALARERLLAAGVSEVREESACTICDERYFSYRREGSSAGRQAGVAWLS